MSSVKEKRINRLLLPRIILLVVMDVLVVNAAAFLAMFIRYEFDYEVLRVSGFLLELLDWVWLNILVTLATFLLFRLYSSLWGFAGADELLHIFGATMLVGAVQMALILLGVMELPRSFPVLFSMLLFISTTVLRCSYRFARRLNMRLRQENGQRTMLIGAGQAGALVLREFKNSRYSQNRVVCIIDDDPT